MNHNEQKKQITIDIIEILSRTVSKLKKKKLDYDFDMMLSDFKNIITQWSL